MGGSGWGSVRGKTIPTRRAEPVNGRFNERQKSRISRCVPAALQQQEHEAAQAEDDRTADQTVNEAGPRLGCRERKHRVDRLVLRAFLRALGIGLYFCD